jgi:hypothetical protein
MPTQLWRISEELQSCVGRKDDLSRLGLFGAVQCRTAHCLKSRFVSVGLADIPLQRTSAFRPPLRAPPHAASSMNVSEVQEADVA